MTDYKKLSGSKVTFVVQIQKKDIEVARKQAMDMFRRNLNLKGFRKGQVPDEVVLEQVGEGRIHMEALNRVVDEQYKAFVKAHKLAVVAAPAVDVPNPDADEMEVVFTVEVFPEIDLGKYQKLKIKVPEVKVKSGEVDDVIETVCSQMQLGVTVDRKAKKKDLVEISFAGRDEKGEIIPRTDGSKVKIRIGVGQLLPDLENACVGMRAGEKKEGVKVKFPKDYPASDLAGNKVPFNLEVHTVQEISAEDVDEGTIEKITGKKMSLEAFRDEVELTIRTNKQGGEKQKAIAEYNGKLAKMVKVDLPESWLDKEVESRMEKIRQNPQFQSDPEGFWAATGKREDKVKKQFREDGERDLKTFLALSKIVEEEKIELDKDEQEKAHQMAHKHLGEGAGHEGADHGAEMHRAQMSLKIDKYLQGLMIG